jgi:hypothetical protein
MSCSSSTADFRPAQYNIQIWRNDTWVQTFSISADGVAVNLAGSTIIIQVRKTAYSSPADLTLTNGSGITITGVNSNMVVLNKLVNIAAGNYVYDMNVTFPSGIVRTYVWGNFLVQEDITKA